MSGRCQLQIGPVPPTQTRVLFPCLTKERPRQTPVRGVSSFYETKLQGVGVI
jgi:hypothetical protein